MAFPSSFQARIQDMDGNRQRLLERLQAEKELHKSKSLHLSKQQEMLSKIKQRCFVLKQKEAEFSVKVLEKEEEMQEADKTTVRLELAIRCLQVELDRREQLRQRNLNYYDQQKSTMDLHKCKLQADILNLKAEVNKLRETFLQLEAHLTEVQDSSSVMGHLDAEICKEEQRKNDMLAQINALDAQAGKNCIIKASLDQSVQQAHKEIEDKNAILEKQRLEIMELQLENQSLENRVLEALQIRDQRKRSGFGGHFRNKA